MAIDLRKNTGGSGFHYQLNGTTHGPVPLEKLLELIDGETLVWYEGSEWKPAKDQPELQRFFQTKVVKEKVPVEKKVVVEKVLEKEVKVAVPTPVSTKSNAGGYMGMLILGLLLGGGGYMAYARVQQSKEAELKKAEQEHAAVLAARDSSEAVAMTMEAEARLKRMQGLMWSGSLAGIPAQFLIDVVSLPHITGRVIINGMERPVVGGAVMTENGPSIVVSGTAEGPAPVTLSAQLGEDMGLEGVWSDGSDMSQPCTLAPTNAAPDLPEAWWVCVEGFATEAEAQDALNSWASAGHDEGDEGYERAFVPHVRSANGMSGAAWSYYVVAGVVSTRDSALALEKTLRAPRVFMPNGIPTFSFNASRGRLRSCVVRSPQAYLHSIPNSAARTSKYVIANDQLLVSAERGAFLHVAYVHPETGLRTDGWVSMTDCQCNP
jgi:hypothetical protein